MLLLLFGVAHAAPLSPDDAVVAALASNPGVARAGAEFAAAKGAARQSAFLRENPEIQGGYGLADGRVDLAVSQPLSLTGEGLADHDSQRARLAAAEAAAERTRLVVAAETRNAYVDATIAREEAAGASASYEAAEERLRVLGVDPGALDGEHFPSRFPVKSPVAGEVLAAEVSIGEAVAPGTPLFHVGNLDLVWVLLDVFERDLSRVSRGQEVRFTVDAWPGEAFAGVIDWVGSVVEADSRTIEVRLIVENADHRLKPGMFGRADLGANDPAAAPTVVVPAEAVQEVEGRASVFVEEEGAFEARAVTLGLKNAVEVQVLSGLEPGEPVVVKGAFTLKSELAKAEMGEGHAH